MNLCPQMHTTSHYIPINQIPISPFENTLLLSTLFLFLLHGQEMNCRVRGGSIYLREQPMRHTEDISELDVLLPDSRVRNFLGTRESAVGRDLERAHQTLGENGGVTKAKLA